MRYEEARQPAVSGQFYPATKPRLKGAIEGYLQDVKPTKLHGAIKAMIVPHAGYVYSGPIAASGYAQLAGVIKNIRRIILLGPSHFVYLSGFVADNNPKWLTPLGTIDVADNTLPKMGEPHLQEHSLEVQVPFIQHICDLAKKKIEILPIVAGDANPEEIASQIIPLLDEKTFLIISSDLSHYLPYEAAKAKDIRTIHSIKQLDFNGMAVHGDACGKIPILAMINIARQQKWRPELLDYRNSGDTSGDKSRVVGYASIAFLD